MINIKLSEAIRLGSKMKPQAFDGWFDGKGTCALGAAFDSLGVLSSVKSGETAPAEHFPILYKVGGECPACSNISRGFGFGFDITHLNDRHRWSREAIAEWVETIEDNCGEKECKEEPIAPEPTREKELVTVG